MLLAETSSRSGESRERGATQCVRRSLAALELAASRFRHRIRGRLNVNDQELTALLCIAHADGVTQARLQRFTTLSRSGLGAMVQRLERDGFIERRPDPDDRRLRAIRLSDVGRARIESACRDLDDAVARALARCSQAELDALDRLLTDLADTIDAVNTDATAGPSAAARPREPIWRHWG